MSKVLMDTSTAKAIADRARGVNNSTEKYKLKDISTSMGMIYGERELEINSTMGGYPGASIPEQVFEAANVSSLTHFGLSAYPYYPEGRDYLHAVDGKWDMDANGISTFTLSLNGKKFFYRAPGPALGTPDWSIYPLTGGLAMINVIVNVGTAEWTEEPSMAASVAGTIYSTSVDFPVDLSILTADWNDYRASAVMANVSDTSLLMVNDKSGAFTHWNESNPVMAPRNAAENESSHIANFGYLWSNPYKLYVWVRSGHTIDEIKTNFADAQFAIWLNGYYEEKAGGSKFVQQQDAIDSFNAVRTRVGENLLAFEKGFAHYTSAYGKLRYLDVADMADYPVRGFIKIEDWESAAGSEQFLCLGKEGQTIPTDTLRKW